MLINCLKFLLIFCLLFFALPFGGGGGVGRIVISLANFITIIYKEKHVAKENPEVK